MGKLVKCKNCGRVHELEIPSYIIGGDGFFCDKSCYDEWVKEKKNGFTD